ncbi:MAG: ATPase, T2SS/T4P/T4SS family [Phycisphaeraceae bacterium]
MQGILSTLIDEQVLTREAARMVPGLCDEGRSLDQAVREAGADEKQLLNCLGRQLGLLVIEDVEQEIADEGLLQQFPAKLLLERQLLPLRLTEERAVVVATGRGMDLSAVDELRVIGGRDVEIALAPSADVERVLRERLGVGADTIQSLNADNGIEVLDENAAGDDIDLESAAEDASIIRFVNQILTEAIRLRATDVHFEPFEHELRVRYRVDGVLVEANIPTSVGRFRAAIVSRLKILAHLDIAEKRLPQDGRIKLKMAGNEIDVRVSVIPMLHGEAVVLRILDRSATMFGLQHLGMGDRDHHHFERVLHQPHGIVLVTGPTGSGKTTTLYAGLSRINEIERKIITIEDPIEYQLHGVNQIQVSDKTGMTFAKGLRAILRHDPDVVLVGEIRDKETAQIAVQASLTGHLVFSTLHTNDAPGALTRLVEMGVEPYLVASSLEMVIAQRLVRLICEECKEEITLDDAALLRERHNIDLPDRLWVGRGCRACSETGYRGRKGIFEMMPVNDRIRAMVLENRSSREIRRAAEEDGMSSLRTDGWRLVRAGITTLEEVMRVTKDEAASQASAAAASNGTTDHDDDTDDVLGAWEQR